MGILYVLIGIFATVFVESFVVALCNFRILFLGILVLFRKINWRYLTVFIVVTSLALDVIYHYVLGTNLLAVGIPLLVMLGLSLFIPMEGTFGSYAAKFFCIFLYYSLIYWLPNLFLGNGLRAIEWYVMGGILLKAFVSILIYITLELLGNRLRKREEGTRLRLR